MNWKQYVLGIIATGIMIPLLKSVISRIKHLSRTDKVEISLKIPEEILSTGTKFGLLHVRDGRGKVSDRGPVLNKVMWFKEVDRRGNLKTSVRYIKNLGFEFKCFANYTTIDFNELKKVLEKNGYLHVSKGAGKPKRAWFIHPDYPHYITDGINENNYFYPE